jgi:hypothetical protein
MIGKAKRVRPVDSEGYNFGVIEIDGASNPPKVSFELVRPDAKRVWSKFTVTAPELANGKGDWKSKVADMGKWKDVVNQ